MNGFSSPSPHHNRVCVFAVYQLANSLSYCTRDALPCLPCSFRGVVKEAVLATTAPDQRWRPAISGCTTRETSKNQPKKTAASMVVVLEQPCRRRQPPPRRLRAAAGAAAAGTLWRFGHANPSTPKTCSPGN